MQQLKPGVLALSINAYLFTKFCNKVIFSQKCSLSFLPRVSN